MLGWIVDRTAKHDRNQVLLVDEYLNNLWYTHAMGYAFSGKRIWALNLGQDKEKYANTEHRERLILETTTVDITNTQYMERAEPWRQQLRLPVIGRAVEEVRGE